MIMVYRSLDPLRLMEPLGAYATTDAALRSLPANCFIERDADYPECYDAFDYESGDIFIIQPEGFKL